MGEKGNVLDTTEEVLANLAEQGPQFLTVYEQYKLARGKGDQGTAAAHPALWAQTSDPVVEETGRPAAG